MGLINYTTDKINDLLDKVNEAPEVLENGKTPVFITGITTTLDPCMSATAEVVMVGTDSKGNPQYKINFGVPKGLDGAGGSGGGVADSVQWANVLNKPSWVNSATKPSYTASEVGSLPAGTFIPTKTSDIKNDSGFLTSDNFKTINGQSIVGEGNITIQEGGGSSGGAGNVNVTNVSTLRNNRLYSFKPSEDGSSVGVFSELPNAGMTNDGLMTSADYEKLITLKPCVYLPIAFEQVNSSTTKEELISLFNNIPELSIENYSTLVYFFMLLCSGSNGEGSVDVYKFYIGNNDCFFRGTYSEDGTNLQADFTYIVIGGKLRTISINISNIDSSDMSSAELSINVMESDDDIFYLPKSVIDLKTATEESLKYAFGGEDAIRAFIQEAIVGGKSVYIRFNRIKDSTGSGMYGGLSYNIPVSIECTAFAIIVIRVSFIYSITNNTFLHKRIIFNYIVGSNSYSAIEIAETYLNGYNLNKDLYSLSDSSTSDDISIAIGGEDGMKRIIKAIKDGNTFFTVGSLGDGNQKTQLLPNIYAEKENGDLSIAFVGFGYMLWGGLGGLLKIDYTKISNTFTCSIAPIG